MGNVGKLSVKLMLIAVFDFNSSPIANAVKNSCGLSAGLGSILELELELIPIQIPIPGIGIEKELNKRNWNWN